MGSQKWTDEHFGKRVKAEREYRGWSQADMAKLLSDKGIHPMHPTTVAKIEAGDRSVRINEAVGIADLFEVSLDSLLGRKPGAQQDELQYVLRLLRGTARQSSQQVEAIMETIHQQLEELPIGYDGADQLQRIGSKILERLKEDSYGLTLVADISASLLYREQGEGAPG